MIRLLIVDDEPIIGKGIQAMLRDYLKYQVEGIVQNGLEAWKFLQEHEVDIVLTDIEMPQMDGIQLAQKIREAKKAIPIIFLTAFRDFEYAQAAITYKIDNYLVKPIDEEHLIAALAKAELSLNEKQNLDHFILKEQLQQFFYGKKLPKLNHLTMEDDKQNLCILYIQKTNADQVAIQSFWEKIFRVYKTAISFEIKTNSIYFLLEGPERIDWQVEVYYLQKFYPNWHFVASKGFNHLNEIYFILGEIQRERNQQFFSMIPKETSNFSEISHEYLLDLIKQNADSRMILEYLKSLMQKECSHSNYDLLLFFKNMAVLHSQVLKQLSSKLKKLELTKEKSKLMIATWENELTFDSYQQVVLHQYEEILVTHGNAVSLDVPEDIFILKKYIKKNYARDISLEELAALVHKNKSYVSAYFKKHTGTSFKAFQTDFRMKEAKNLLLNTNKRIYEIADETGYIGTHHFNKVFSNYYGKSPTQFREQS
ncbi:MAG TPA: response regulator [Candidatus Tetragenococcus pullicola]|nr:response regulator [Candidatus Tetragenococcus pullicola]